MKAEAEATEAKIDIDVESVLNELRKLRQLLSNWSNMKLIPPAAYDTASSILKTIEKQLKAVN